MGPTGKKGFFCQLRVIGYGYVLARGAFGLV